MTHNNLHARRAALPAMFALALSLSACKPDNGSAVPPPDGVKKVQLTSCLDESTFYLPGEGSDNFYLSLYAGEVELYEASDGSAYVPATQESHLLHLDLYCTPAGNGEILLPEGTYTVAGNTDAGSACSDYTFALQYFEDGNVDYADPADGGTVVVRHTADGYSIPSRSWT